MSLPLCVVVLTGLLIPPAGAVTRTDWAKCAAIADSIKRLECFDAVAQKLGVDTPTVNSAPTGKWQVQTEISPIDDSKNVYIIVDANEEVRGWMSRSTPSLVIRCKENSTDLYFNVGMQVDTDRIGSGAAQFSDVTLRLDKEKAFVTEMSHSTDGKALFAHNPIDLIKAFFGKSVLLFRFTPFNASPVTTSFDITSLAQAIKPLRKACHW